MWEEGDRIGIDVNSPIKPENNNPQESKGVITTLCCILV